MRYDVVCHLLDTRVVDAMVSIFSIIAYLSNIQFDNFPVKNYYFVSHQSSVYIVCENKGI